MDHRLRRPAERARERPIIANYEDWLVASYGHTFAGGISRRRTRASTTRPSAGQPDDRLDRPFGCTAPRSRRSTCGALWRRAAPNVHYVTGFRYPTHGGFADYLRTFIAAARSEARATRPCTSIPGDTEDHQVRERRVLGRVRRIGLLGPAAPDLFAILADVPRGRSGGGVAPRLLVVRARQRRGRATCVTESAISTSTTRTSCFSRLLLPFTHVIPQRARGRRAIQAEVYFSEKYRSLTQARDLDRSGYRRP